MNAIAVLIILLFYFAPTIAGIINQKSGRDIAFIFAGNLIFGWTIIGWLMMAWKATKKEIRV